MPPQRTVTASRPALHSTYRDCSAVLRRRHISSSKKREKGECERIKELASSRGYTTREADEEGTTTICWRGEDPGYNKFVRERGSKRKRKIKRNREREEGENTEKTERQSGNKLRSSREGQNYKEETKTTRQITASAQQPS